MRRLGGSVAVAVLVFTAGCGGGGDGAGAPKQEAPKQEAQSAAAPTYDAASASFQEKWVEFQRLAQREGVPKSNWPLDRSGDGEATADVICGDAAAQNDYASTERSVYAGPEYEPTKSGDLVYTDAYCPDRRPSLEEAFAKVEKPEAAKASPKPSVKAVSYGSVTELRDAAIEAGYTCLRWQQDNAVTLAAESGNCGDDSVLSTYASPGDLQAQLRQEKEINRMLLDEDIPTESILVGPNWLLKTPAAPRLRAQLGGIVIGAKRPR